MNVQSVQHDIEVLQKEKENLERSVLNMKQWELDLAKELSERESRSDSLLSAIQQRQNIMDGMGKRMEIMKSNLVSFISVLLEQTV